VLLVGFKTQWALLAIWSLITGFAVHLVAGVSDAHAMVAYDNMIHFYNNLAIAGGLLFVLVYGAGRLSIDGRLRARDAA
jgi:putative oxidoreductase